MTVMPAQRRIGARRLAVGIDAGGTTVRVRCADVADGTLVSEVSGSASPDGGPGGLLELLGRSAIVEKSDVVSVCAGVAKLTRPGIRDAWEAELSARFPSAFWECVPDFAIAYSGAVSGAAGVLIIAGTGSVAYGENGVRQVRVGGRGWEYGDEGSGAWLTAEIVRRTVRAFDGLGPASPLTHAAAAYLGCNDASDVPAAVSRHLGVSGGVFWFPSL